ncbi:uncharacterized protein LOC144124778 [Amblyomma americanum]
MDPRAISTTSASGKTSAGHGFQHQCSATLRVHRRIADSGCAATSRYWFLPTDTKVGQGFRAYSRGITGEEETDSKMKFLVPLLVLLAVSASYASPHYPRETEEQDDLTEEYWKGKLGWIMEQLGKWLQQSAASQSSFYSADDSAATTGDFTIQHLRTVAQLLNKVADAAEKK